MNEGKRIGKASTSCTECQRRKQKCSREWPCNHCQSRNISHLCQFVVAGRKSNRVSKPSNGHKRKLSGTPKSHVPVITDDVLVRSDEPTLPDDEGFRALGYMPFEENSSLSPLRAAPISDADCDFFTSDTKNFLGFIPPKPYADSLVQYFLKEVNYQYYILFPLKFSQDYAAWWTKRTNGQKLGAAFTSLLLRICACATQSVGGELRKKLEIELGEKTQSLSQRYHEAAQQLSSKIPSGKGGITLVQQLFLTASWFKTEALFAESWQVLGSAIHKAQELGMHRDASNKRYSDFECEMRRRVWCILYIWDWQMSASLSRPLIISSGKFELPTGRLENTSGDSQNPPSPVTHMIFQCQLIQDLMKITNIDGDIVPSIQVLIIKQVIDSWFESFPPVYRLSNPDTRWDEEYPYVLSQRLQLHTIGRMIMFQQLKPYLIGKPSESKANSDPTLANLGVDCALTLVHISHQFYDLAYPIHSTFHLVIFVMFDTIATLCSAMMYDIDCKLSRREEAIESISSILDLMKQTQYSAKTAIVCYRTLSKLVTKLPLPVQEKIPHLNRPPSSFDGDTVTHGISPTNTSAGHSLTFSGTPENSLETELKTPPLFDIPELPIGDGYFPGFGDLSVMDLGGMDEAFDWGTIGLDFASEPVS